MLLIGLCLIAVSVKSLAASNVLILSDGNFTDNIAVHSIAVVKFYVPWCGHCKNLAPEYEKAANTLKKAKSTITLFEVDCSESGKSVCIEYKVKSYPTLKVFKYGELFSDYTGPKHAAGIVQHLRSSALPGSRELKTVLEADTFLSSEENCVLGFFEPTNTVIEAEFHRLADGLKDQYRFAHTYNNRLLTRYGYRNEVVIIRAPHLQNKLEPPHVKYEGEVSLYKMRSWVTENYHGLVGIRTSLNMDEFRRPLITVYYKLDFKGKNAKESSYWRNRIMLMARKFEAPGKRKVHFAVSDADEFRRELTDVGITYSDNMHAVVARDTRENRYVMNESFSIENLEQFVEDLLVGKLKPYVKSAPLPESNDKPVKTVVAENFDSIVGSTTKHVLIYFHAPWCGQCPEVEKTFEKLASKVNSDDITFASMDATKNDVPKQFVIKSFPAVFLVRSDVKMTPSSYEGQYEIDDLVNFLSDAIPDVMVKTKTKSAKKISKSRDNTDAIKTEL